MKKILMLAGILLPAMLFAQNVFTVSNVPGLKANYATLQGALDSAADGSVLYLFPSKISYGKGIVNKKVVIYGAGFLLDQNAVPASNPNVYGVNIQYLDVKPGGSNSYVEGVQFNGLSFTQDPNLPNGTPVEIDSAINVIISRCAFFPHGGGYFITTKTTYNCIVRDCYMDVAESGEGNSSYVLNDNNSGSTGLQFLNNIITNRRTGMQFYCANITAASDVTFTNNTIITNLKGADFRNLKYINNIIVDANGSYNVDPASVYMKGSTLRNNISNCPGLFDSTSANISKANADSIFVFSQFGFHGEDQQWQLQTGKFANTYGVGGIPCGAFGGQNPYTLSGIPHLPNTYSLSLAPDLKKRGNVLVSIKAKATN